VFNLVKQVVKDISTERDGVSFDITKVLWVIGTLIFLGLTIYVVTIKNQPFSFVDWGIAFASMLAGGSAGIKFKETNEQPLPNGGEQDQTIRENIK